MHVATFYAIHLYHLPSPFESFAASLSNKFPVEMLEWKHANTKMSGLACFKCLIRIFPDDPSIVQQFYVV